MAQQADYLIRDAIILTQNSQRTILHDGAIAIVQGRIAAIGETQHITREWTANNILSAKRRVITPGLINAHIHMTGPALFPGIEPGSSPIADHFPKWVMPPHAVSEPEDEQAAARFVVLQMLKHGTTAFIEPGICRFPAAVLNALDDLPLKGAIGAWVSDMWPIPFGPSDTPAAIAALEEALKLKSKNGRIRVWPNIIGHNGCSDELYKKAHALAQQHDVHWTFHMSAMSDDGDHYRAQSGHDPLVHFDKLGILDERAIIAHGIHLSHAEVDVLKKTNATVAYCPVCSLRLCTGITKVGKHPDLPHVAIGTDTQNASNHLDLLRSAATACDLYGEIRGERASLTAPKALDWLTIEGARALQLSKEIGSLEIGKAADFAIFDAGWPIYNVANALVHGSARAEHVFIDGQAVLVNGKFEGEEKIIADAEAAGTRLAQRIGLPRWTD
ncbi:MAG: amidohydrolase family protein [Gammaproteobacteria bacterium]|nr:amidohydrolase family protein [Gammaproteobacteria bacterium]